MNGNYGVVRARSPRRRHSRPSPLCLYAQSAIRYAVCSLSRPATLIRPLAAPRPHPQRCPGRPQPTVASAYPWGSEVKAEEDNATVAGLCVKRQLQQVTPPLITRHRLAASLGAHSAVTTLKATPSHIKQHRSASYTFLAPTRTYIVRRGQRRLNLAQNRRVHVHLAAVRACASSVCHSGRVSMEASA